MADRHGSHDLEALVAFADGELSGAELEAATSQVEDCPACTELVADLRSLVLAHRELPTPVLRRDLRLTAADAERLGRLGPEPQLVATRLGQDMTGTPAPHPTHATHDAELIAAAVGGRLEESERRLTEAWLATCAACSELHADLLAIVSAERALPNPTRPRDFRLTPADAHRLRPRGFQAILAAIGSSRDAFSKPLAVGLTTLGLVGLLVGTIPSFGSATGASTILSTVGDSVGAEGAGDGTVFGGQDVTPSAAPSAAAAAAPEVAASPAASATAEPAPASAAPIVGSEAPRDAYVTPAGDTSAAEDTTLEATRLADEAARLSSEAEGPSALLIASLALLAAGIGLFAVRWVARRLRAT